MPIEPIFGDFGKFPITLEMQSAKFPKDAPVDE